MKDVKNIFRGLENRLREAKWFGDDWDIYNRDVYLQLYKINWHNHHQGGIHFETYIEKQQIKQKTFHFACTRKMTAHRSMFLFRNF